ncbi:MAG TPA: prolyl oligopeptidase family serine peptidase [Acidobacteriaceae bacterium]|nr:prolyl oligopeptidase family serine peptidase [Acidobacteriaceae bacterium]
MNGYHVPVEIYRPNGSGPFPLVFVLVGSAGALTRRSVKQPATDNFGEQQLASHCFLVVLPHYLEAVGRKSLTSREEIIARFPELLSAAATLLDDGETRPRMKGRPVFILGDSLGGYIGVALALRRSEVTAVSEVSAGRPKGYDLARKNEPRILISHGSADAVVPVSEAQKLRQYCIAHSIPVVMNIYPGEGHYLSQTIQQRIILRSIKFFLNNHQAPDRRANRSDQAPRK